MLYLFSAFFVGFVVSQDCQLGENCGGQDEYDSCGTPCPLVCGQTPTDFCFSSCNAAYFCPSGEAFNTYTGACEDDQCADDSWEFEEALCTSYTGVNIYESGPWTNPDNACDQGDCMEDGYFAGLSIDCQPYGCDDEWCVNCDDSQIFVTFMGQCCGQCAQVGSVCTLSDGETFVQQGWSGNGIGENCCNECMCDEWGLTCTEMYCSDCSGGDGGDNQSGDDCHPDFWNIGYGTCDTYGTDGFNNAYCDYDCNSCGCASDICEECSEHGSGGGGSDGGSYCTWSPNYDCFSSGWPECCMVDYGECPEEQPDCEVSEECEQDIDGDGNVSFPDVLEILSAWGECDSCAADLDNDGGVNMDDLVAILANWGCGSN